MTIMLIWLYSCS